MIIYPDRSRDHKAARNKCAHMTDDTDWSPSTSGSDRDYLNKASDLQVSTSSINAVMDELATCYHAWRAARDMARQP